MKQQFLILIEKVSITFMYHIWNYLNPHSRDAVPCVLEKYDFFSYEIPIL